MPEKLITYQINTTEIQQISVVDLLKRYGIKQSHIANVLGLKRTTCAFKLNNNKFTDDELLKLQMYFEKTALEILSLKIK